MCAWGAAVVPRLRALGLRVEGFTADEERVVFVPDGRLTLAFDGKSHVEVSLQLPPRDVPALRARLADAERALELTTVIEALPEQFETGASRGGRRVPASGASSDELRALFERIEREQQSLWLGWRVPRAAAVAHAALLDELLEDALVALGGLLALVAWTPASEANPRPVHPDRRSRTHHDDEATTRTRGGSNGNSGSNGHRGTDGGHGADRSKHRERARLRNSRERDAEGETEAESESAREGEAAPSTALLAANLRVALRPDLRRRGLGGVDPRAPVEKGAHVRVTEGPFAGKVGIVQKLDGRGGVRVMLGLLAVRLDVKDVVACAEGRPRPLLSSSHRKPLQARRVRW